MVSRGHYSVYSLSPLTSDARSNHHVPAPAPPRPTLRALAVTPGPDPAPAFFPLLSLSTLRNFFSLFCSPYGKIYRWVPWENLEKKKKEDLQHRCCYTLCDQFHVGGYGVQLSRRNLDW